MKERKRKKETNKGLGDQTIESKGENRMRILIFILGAVEDSPDAC